MIWDSSRIPAKSRGSHHQALRTPPFHKSVDAAREICLVGGSIAVAAVQIHPTCELASSPGVHLSSSYDLPLETDGATLQQLPPMAASLLKPWKRLFFKLKSRCGPPLLEGLRKVRGLETVAERSQEYTSVDVSGLAKEGRNRCKDSAAGLSAAPCFVQ